MAAPSISEAVVLRSFPFGEADRVLHVYTAASGRLGAMAKGVRRTKSRFGGRLEPFSHVELSLHRGRGELATVTGASLVRSHDRVRSDPLRLRIGLVGLEAMVVFYVVLTPIWLGLRAAAWVAELRARLRGDQAGSRR